MKPEGKGREKGTFVAHLAERLTPVLVGHFLPPVLNSALLHVIRFQVMALRQLRLRISSGSFLLSPLVTLQINQGSEKSRRQTILVNS